MFKDKGFWIDTFYRCLWTAAEVLMGTLIVGKTFAEIPWKHTLSVTIVAVIGCLIKQIGIYSRQHIKEEYDDNK